MRIIKSLELSLKCARVDTTNIVLQTWGFAKRSGATTGMRLVSDPNVWTLEYIGWLRWAIRGDFDSVFQTVTIKRFDAPTHDHLDAAFYTLFVRGGYSSYSKMKVRHG